MHLDNHTRTVSVGSSSFSSSSVSGLPPLKRKRCWYTEAQKRIALYHWHKHQSVSATAAFFGISRGLLYQWKRLNPAPGFRTAVDAGEASTVRPLPNLSTTAGRAYGCGKFASFQGSRERPYSQKAGVSI